MVKMNKKQNLVDTTVLSTPLPTASSTTHKRKMYRDQTFDLKKANLVFDSNESLGIISIKSDDLNSILDENQSDIGSHLRKQRELANSSLQRATRLSGLPSRYLRPSDVSKFGSESCLNISSGSTISESDLFKYKSHMQGDTSTPRSSIMSDAEPRYSLGKSMADLSHKIRNTDISLDNFAEEFKKVMQSVIVEENSSMFTPAEEAEAKLLADEISWRKENDVPGQTSLCFTEAPSLPIKESMGEFFRLKSESLSDLDILKASPEKKAPPVPLINMTTASLKSLDASEQADSSVRGSSEAHKSLTVSKIAQILEEHTPRRIIDYLLNEGRQQTQETTESTLHRSSDITAIKKPIKLSPKKLINSSTIYGSTGYEDNFNKENVNSLNIQDSANSSSVSRKSPDYDSNFGNRSLTSVRSTSSLSNLVNGKLPIDATRTELIWGCVKPGKSVVQEVLVRNKSQYRLRIQCSLSGPSYKILRDRPDSEFVSIAKYVFHPGESKTISVQFAPLKVGAAIDYIVFTPSDPHLQQCKNQRISLFGYGGTGNVDISNITKDITGRFWLCLGQLNNQTAISQNIIVQNNGTIPSFACVAFESKDMYSFANVEVSPSKFALLPQEQKHITVTYTPSRHDLKFFQAATNNAVIDIGVLKFVTGTEANRGRVRRLCKQAKDKGLSISPICQRLIEVIPGEIMPPDVKMFQESLGNMTDLLQEFSIKEVVVTIEQDPESTLVAQFPDDTLHFQTLCRDSTMITDETTKHAFKLEPGCVILTPPTKMEDVLLVTSDHTDRVNFEVDVESKDLIVNPSKGVLDPHETLFVSVKCVKNVGTVKSYKVYILVNDIKLESTVKVMQVRL